MDYLPELGGQTAGARRTFPAGKSDTYSVPRNFSQEIKCLKFCVFLKRTLVVFGKRKEGSKVGGENENNDNQESNDFKMKK